MKLRCRPRLRAPYGQLDRGRHEACRQVHVEHGRDIRRVHTTGHPELGVGTRSCVLAALRLIPLPVGSSVGSFSPCTSLPMLDSLARLHQLRVVRCNENVERAAIERLDRVPARGQRQLAVQNTSANAKLLEKEPQSKATIHAIHKDERTTRIRLSLGRAHT